MTYKNSRGRVYPQDMQCVMDPVEGKGGIFIGNLQASQNLQTLKKHGIGAVLTAAKGIFLNHPKDSVPHYLYVPADDHQFFDISVYFDQSVQFIARTLKQTNLLVHCMAGISRSVSLVIAYLIKIKGMRYLQAYTFLKLRRRIVNPNRGFVKQLQSFERQMKKISKTHSTHTNGDKTEKRFNTQEDNTRRHTLCSFNRNDISLDYIDIKTKGKIRPIYHQVQNPENYCYTERLNKEKLRSRVDKILEKHNYKYSSYKSNNLDNSISEIEKYAHKYFSFKKNKPVGSELNHYSTLNINDYDSKPRWESKTNISNFY